MDPVGLAKFQAVDANYGQSKPQFIIGVTGAALAIAVSVAAVAAAVFLCIAPPVLSILTVKVIVLSVVIPLTGGSTLSSVLACVYLIRKSQSSPKKVIPELKVEEAKAEPLKREPEPAAELKTVQAEGKIEALMGEELKGTLALKDDQIKELEAHLKQVSEEAKDEVQDLKNKRQEDQMRFLSHLAASDEQRKELEADLEQVKEEAKEEIEDLKNKGQEDQMRFLRNLAASEEQRKEVEADLERVKKEAKGEIEDLKNKWQEDQMRFLGKLAASEEQRKELEGDLRKTQEEAEAEVATIKRQREEDQEEFARHLSENENHSQALEEDVKRVQKEADSALALLKRQKQADRDAFERRFTLLEEDLNRVQNDAQADREMHERAILVKEKHKKELEDTLKKVKEEGKREVEVLKKKGKEAQEIADRNFNAKNKQYQDLEAHLNRYKDQAEAEIAALKKQRQEDQEKLEVLNQKLRGMDRVCSKKDELPPLEYTFKADFRSLKNLVNIEEGQVVDIKKNGSVSEPYKKGGGWDYSSVRRYVTGEGDITNLKPLLQRVLISYRSGDTPIEDYLRSAAVKGLPHLRKSLDQEEAKKMDEIVSFILNSLDKVEGSGFRKMTKKEIDRYHELNQLESSSLSPIVQEGTQGALEGVDYYITRIGDFLFYEKDKLKDEDQTFLREIDRALRKAKEIHDHNIDYGDMIARAKPLCGEENEDEVLRHQAIDQAHQELLEERIASVLNDLDQMPPNYRSEIGLFYPMRWKWSHENRSEGHIFFITLCKERDGTYSIAQANAGGLALGEWKSIDRNCHLYLPPIVEFLQLDREKVVQFLKIVEESKFRLHRDRQDAYKKYEELFAPIIKNKPDTSRIPARRQQITNNCGVRSLKEALIYSFQKSKRVELANPFFRYADPREEVLADILPLRDR